MTEQSNVAKELMGEMSEKFDIAEKNSQIATGVIDKRPEAFKEEDIKLILNAFIDLCESEKVTDKQLAGIINILIVTFTAYPELKDFFKENLGNAIIKIGLPNKKIDMDKLDPLNKIWTIFF